MSKRYNIRWRESDQKELTRAVKNFNAKIDRVSKKIDPKDRYALPEKVSVKDLKDIISTRKDLNRTLNHLKRFSNRGAEELVILPDNQYNTSVTKWEKQELVYYKQMVNTSRAKRKEVIENIERTDSGEKLGYTVGQVGMNRADKVALEPIESPFYYTMDRRNVHSRMKSYRKHAWDGFYDDADKIFIDNYIGSMEETYGAENVKEIVEVVRKTPISTLIEKIHAEDKMFEFNYAFDDDEFKKNLEKLYSIWLPNKKPPENIKMTKKKKSKNKK